MAFGNPAPLGLLAFGLTTFILSCYNAEIFGAHDTTPVNVVVGVAVFYGGAAQFVAGMWALGSGNTFAATAFASYGGFWLSYAALLIPGFGVGSAFSTDQDAEDLSHAIAIFLLAWTILTVMLLVASFQTTAGLAILFVFLTTTFLLLTIAEYKNSNRVKRAAGFFGIFTAIIAFYNGLAGILASQNPPLITLPDLKLHSE